MKRWGHRIYRAWSGSLKYKLIVYFIAISILPLMLVSYLVHDRATQMALTRDTAHFAELNQSRMSALDRALQEIAFVIGDVTTNFHTTYYLQNIDAANYESDRSFNVLSEVGAKLDNILAAKPLLYDAIVLLPRKGGLPFFRGLTKLAYTDDFTAHPLYLASAEHSTQILWNYALTEGKPELVVSKSIMDVFDGEVLGVALFYINVPVLLEEMEQAESRTDESTMIVNEAGQLVYHSDAGRMGSMLSEQDRSGLAQIWQEDSGSFTRVADGASYVVTFMTSKVNGWKMFHIMPYATITQGVDQLSRTVLAVTLVVGGFAVFLASGLYLGLYRPIAMLMRAMKRVEIGQFGERVHLRRVDELGSLARAFNFLVERIGVLIDDVKQEQREKKEQEIRALQAQITPHFLYNTIHGIKSLARMNRPQEIEGMAGALIDLLRISARGDRDTVTLRDELHYVRSYAKIMEFRYQMPIEITVVCDEELLDCAILKFTLQPLVENAILHAFTRDMEDRSIVIDVQAHEDDLTIAVRDNGSGIPPERFAERSGRCFPVRVDSARQAFNSMGIANIHDRLQLHFGEPYGLTFESRPGEGTTVLVELPRQRFSADDSSS
ncbi:two-component sensor histidine kinase [Paenibacillus sp. 598K]|uniref:cache domain-containing sensor histidine kinase n=1 Tax=Paenibacillus sp. 598K TaxID=1117987 RepID=UPI000FF976DC|nr:sensor histidine kinase [Paenibacillus sp. 598K]GBF76376.1 two-component sensor histidine kinase [Paenibacillus sp. 598K]